MSEPGSIDERFAAAHAKLRTVATTGTNGKTTTTSMVASIVAAAGEPAARITTVGAWIGKDVGDTVTVNNPKGKREFEVTNVEWLEVLPLEEVSS